MIPNWKKLTLFYGQKTNIIHLMVIICITAMIYWPAHSLRFLHGWDDQWAIFNYFTEDGLTWSNLYSIVTTFFCGQYAPVNQIYYTLMYSIFGYDPKYFHVLGVIIHILNAILIYYLLFKVANQISGIRSLKNSQIAFMASLLFSISPFNLEPVAWVAATKVTLYAMFYFMSVHCYIHYLSSRRAIQYYLTTLLFILSFGAKEQAVTLPVCLLLIDYIYNRNLNSKLLILEKIPFFILSLIFGIISIQSQGKELFEVSEFYPFHERIVLSFYTLSEYFTKTILPVNISYIYPFPFQIGEPVPKFLLIYPTVIPPLLYIYYKDLSKNRWVNFGILFFLIHLILVLNILSLTRFSIVADRYAYVSTIGIYFILAYAIIEYFQYCKKIVITLTFAFFSYYAIYTNQHIKTWTDATTVKRKLKTEIENRADFEQWKNENLEK